LSVLTDRHKKAVSELRLRISDWQLGRELFEGLKLVVHLAQIVLALLIDDCQRLPVLRKSQVLNLSFVEPFN